MRQTTPLHSELSHLVIQKFWGSSEADLKSMCQAYQVHSHGTSHVEPELCVTAFTDLLRKERTLVCSSVELLEYYRRELESGGSISIADMRMAVYALHGIFEATLLLKEERLLYVKMEQLPLPDEIRSLIPLRRIANRKVQEDLLSLRLGIEKNDFQTQTKGPVLKRIEGLVSLVQSYICDTEDHLLNYAHSNLEPATQVELFQVANQIDKADPSGQLLRSLQMVNVLRLARGLPAA